jgi:hypothetical protein
MVKILPAASKYICNRLVCAKSIFIADLIRSDVKRLRQLFQVLVLIIVFLVVVLLLLLHHLFEIEFDLLLLLLC